MRKKVEKKGSDVKSGTEKKYLGKDHFHRDKSKYDRKQDKRKCKQDLQDD